MWKIRQCNLLLLLAFNLNGFVLSLDVGDKCYHNKKVLNGECKLIKDCPDAIIDLKNTIFPQTCGFIKSTVIVCCVGSSVTTAAFTSEKPTTITTKEPDEPRPVGEKSRQKCKEYEEYAFKEEPSPILIVTSETVKTNICPWHLEPNVIRGTECKPGEFPHMALLEYHDMNKTSYKCGGSLISENFVLTAAHCIGDTASATPQIARLGDLNITNPNDDQYLQEIKIKKIYKHKNFDPLLVQNDIALLELENPAVLSIYLKPVCLYTKEELPVNKGLATGWGRTENGPSSDVLLKVWLDLFSEESCSNAFRNSRVPVNYNEMICAGSYTSSKDTCRGDSGGPLQMYSTDVECSYYVFAVTSFGLGCGTPNVPALYTKVYPHLEWIENIVWPR